MAFKHKAKKTSLQIIIQENLDNNEDPKRNILRSNLHGKKKKDKISGNLEHGDLGRGWMEKGEARRGAEKNVKLNKNE